MKDERKPAVLFLCTGNSCRSQMAEGFAKSLLGGQLDAYSAGVEPHGMNPRAVRAMAEAGVDISLHHSKHIDELRAVTFDLIVTVCGNADQACPAIPGTFKRVHHGFDDPPKLAAAAKSDDEAMPHYRRVRDEIKAFIEHELTDLLPREVTT